MQHGFATDPTLLPSMPSCGSMQVDSSSSSLAAGSFSQQIQHSWPPASIPAAAAGGHMIGPSISLPLQEQQQQPSGQSGATPADSYGNDSSSSGSRLLMNSVTHSGGLQQLMPARSDPVKPRGRSGPKSKFSPYIGVSQYKRTGRWEAHIWDSSSSTKGSRATGKSGKGKQLHLGSFLTAAQAARAYDRAALLLRGPHAALNFPLGDYSNDPVLEELSHMSRTDLVLALRKTCDMEMEAAALEAFNAKVPAAAAHILHNITGPNPAADHTIMADQQQQLFGFVDLYGNTLDSDAIAATAAAAAESDGMRYGADMDGLQQQIGPGENSMMMGCLPDFSQPLQQQLQHLQQQQQGLWLQQNSTSTVGLDAVHTASPFHVPQHTEPPSEAAGARSTTFGSYWGQQDRHLAFQGEQSSSMQQQRSVSSSMPLAAAPSSTTLQQALPTSAPQQVFGSSSGRMQPMSSGLLPSAANTYSQHPQPQNLTPTHSGTPVGMPEYGPPPPTGTHHILSTAINSRGAPQDGSGHVIMPHLHQQHQQVVSIHLTSALPTVQSAPLPVGDVRHEVGHPLVYVHQQTEQQKQQFQSSGTARLAPMASAPLSCLQGPPSSGYHSTDPSQCVGGTTLAGVQSIHGHTVMAGSAVSNLHTNSSRPSIPQTLPVLQPQQQQQWHQLPTPSHTEHEMPARPHGPGMSLGSSTSYELAAADSHTKAAAVVAAAGGAEVWGKAAWQSSYIAAAAAPAFAAAAAPAVAAAGLRSWHAASPNHQADSSTSSSGRTGGNSSNNTSSSEQQQQRMGAYPHVGGKGNQPVANLHHISSTNPLTSHTNHHHQQQQQQRVLHNEQHPLSIPWEQLSPLQPFQSLQQQQQQQQVDPAVTRCSVSGGAGNASGNESMPHGVHMMQHTAAHQQQTAVHQQAQSHVVATPLSPPLATAEAPGVITRPLSPLQQHGQQQQYSKQQQQQQQQQQQRASLVPSRGLSPTAVVEGQLSDIHIAGLPFAHSSSMKTISSNTPVMGHTWTHNQQKQEQQQEEHAEVEVAIIPATTAGWQASIRAWSSPSDEVHGTSHVSSGLSFTAAQHRPAPAIRGSSQEPPVDRRSTAGSNTNFHFSPPSPKHGLGHKQRERPSDTHVQHDQQQQERSASAYTPVADSGSREVYTTAATAWQSWQNQQQVGLFDNHAPSTMAPAAGTSSTMTTISNQPQQRLTLAGPPQLATSAEDRTDWVHLLHNRSGLRTPDHHGISDQPTAANLGQGPSIPEHHQDRDAGPRSDSVEKSVWHQHHGIGQAFEDPNTAAAAAAPETAVPGGVLGLRPSATPAASPVHVASAAATARNDGCGQTQQHSPAGAKNQLEQAVPAQEASMDAKNVSEAAAVAAAAVGPRRTISNMTMSNLAPSRTVSSMVLAELARLAPLSGSGDHDAATSQLVLQATSELAGNAEECQYILQECQHLLYHQHSLPGLDQLDLLLMTNGAASLGHHVTQHGQLAEQQQQGQCANPHTAGVVGPLPSAAKPGTALSAAAGAAAATSSPPPETIAGLVPMQPGMPVNVSRVEASPAVIGSSLEALINSSKRGMLDQSTDGAGEVERPAAKRPRSPAPGHSQANPADAPGQSAVAAAVTATPTTTPQHTEATTAVEASGGPSCSASADTRMGPTQHVHSQHGGLGWWEMMQM